MACRLPRRLPHPSIGRRSDLDRGPGQSRGLRSAWWLRDRLIADVSPSALTASAYPDASTFASKAFQVWQSVDGGRTWQPLWTHRGCRCPAGSSRLEIACVFAPQYDPWRGRSPGRHAFHDAGSIATASNAELSSETTPTRCPRRHLRRPVAHFRAAEPAPTPNSSPLPSGGSRAKRHPDRVRGGFRETRRDRRRECRDLLRRCRSVGRWSGG